ncbi:MAG: outer membrane protein assembly factor BamD [Ignavibacteriae bacterium]|nr:MAG: outer membrane protein assembly factor BamD [Ignavibacteriota bacterium]
MRILLLTAALMFTCIGCSKPSAEEMFNKGVEAQRMDQYDNAISTYQQLAETYPDSSRAPEAVYAIGSIYQNHKHSYHEAIQSYRRLLEKYPQHATAANASFLIGFIYNNELKNIDSARIAYEDFMRRYPANQLVASAQFEVANLGKNPADLLNVQSPLAQQKTKPAGKK